MRPIGKTIVMKSIVVLKTVQIAAPAFILIGSLVVFPANGSFIHNLLWNTLAIIHPDHR